MRMMEIDWRQAPWRIGDCAIAAATIANVAIAAAFDTARRF
jgi:hypothetical protein